jgi:hypothetical protein
MELAQAAYHTWQQLNRINSRVERTVQVEKIERLGTDSLQAPKGLAPKDALNPAHQCPP